MSAAAIAAITGLGAVSGFGTGLDALDAGVRRGVSAVRPIRRLQAPGFEHVPAALVPDFDDAKDVRTADLVVEFAVRAGREALARAALPVGTRLALVLGTNVEDRDLSYDAIAGRVGDALGVGGPRLVVSLACASSIASLGVAAELLRRGEADAVLAGGTDAITPALIGGFGVLGALAEGLSRPFSAPYGMSLGEGAGLLVLESLESAQRRGATVEAVLRGSGLAGDAFHATRPAPDGSGVLRAVAMALAESGWTGADVDYVNAHGTGTEANDAAEWLGLRAGLGRDDVPVSSSKGLIGHAQGAAGVLEVIVALLCRRRGVVPPTWGFEQPRPGCPPDPVPVERQGPMGAFLSANAAFGGTNAVVAIGPAAAWAGARRRVYVAGTGRARKGDEREIERRYATERMDGTTLGLTAAVLSAARSAGIRPSRRDRSRRALVTGQASISRSTLKALNDAIDTAGLARIPAAIFARGLLVSPSGSVSRDFGIEGPISVVSAGEVSGLAAIVHAATMLSERDALDVAFAAAAEEEPDTGGACVALGSIGAAVELAGWALGPADAPEAALAAALHRAGRDRVDRVVTGPEGRSVLPAMDAVLSAVAEVAGGRARSVAVVARQGATLSAALVLTGGA